MRELTMSQEEFQEGVRKEVQEAIDQYIVEATNIKIPLIWVGTKQDALRAKLIRKSRKIARGILNYRNGKFKTTPSGILKDVKKSLVREIEKMYVLASEHQLKNHPDYCRYQRMSEYFISNLEEELTARNKEKGVRQLIKTTFQELNQPDELRKKTLSEREATQLIDALLMYNDLTILPTYNHYTTDQKTWRFN